MSVKAAVELRLQSEHDLSEITQNLIAREMGLSLYQIGRLLRKEGVKYSELLYKERKRRYRELVSKKKEYSREELATAIGFNNHSYAVEHARIWKYYDRG